MSEHIRAKAQAVLDADANFGGIKWQTAVDLARHVLDTERRLDVALRGALQSREEMREWLGSDATVDQVCEVLLRLNGYKAPFHEYAWIESRSILAGLIAAMPGGDE